MSGSTHSTRESGLRRTGIIPRIWNELAKQIGWRDIPDELRVPASRLETVQGLNRGEHSKLRVAAKQIRDLYQELCSEGRIADDFDEVFGLNHIPLRFERPDVDRFVVTSNLLFRHAELAEAELCAILRRPFARRLAERRAEMISAINRRAGRTARLQISAFERHFVKWGLGSRGLSFVHEEIEQHERLGSYPQELQEAAATALRFLASEVSKAGLSSHVIEAYCRPLQMEAATRALRSVAFDVGETVLRRVPYRVTGGFCHALDVAAHVLHAKYSWTIEGALTFLLEGECPFSKPERVTYKLAREGTPSCVSRICLELDPTLDERQVLALFRKARSKILKRYKKSSDARLMLANFVYSRSLNYPTEMSTSWRDLMDEWNTKAVEHDIKGQKGEPLTYKDVSTFRKHAEQSRRRILEPTIFLSDFEES
jgi:hypothetical protein